MQSGLNPPYPHLFVTLPGGNPGYTNPLIAVPDSALQKPS
jgi:hypothetical protein